MIELKEMKIKVVEEQEQLIVYPQNTKQALIVCLVVIFTLGNLQVNLINNKRLNSEGVDMTGVMIIGAIVENLIMSVSIFKIKDDYYGKIVCSQCHNSIAGLLSNKEGLIRCTCGQLYYLNIENPHKIILTRVKRN